LALAYAGIVEIDERRQCGGSGDILDLANDKRTAPDFSGNEARIPLICRQEHILPPIQAKKSDGLEFALVIATEENWVFALRLLELGG